MAPCESLSSPANPLRGSGVSDRSPANPLRGSVWCRPPPLPLFRCKSVWPRMTEYKGIHPFKGRRGMKKGGVRLSPLRAFPNHHLPICRSSELIHTRRSSLSLPSREGSSRTEGGGGRRREEGGEKGGEGRRRREREREREREESERERERERESEKERERETDTETEQTKGATHATGQQHKHTLTTLTK